MSNRKASAKTEQPVEPPGWNHDYERGVIGCLLTHPQEAIARFGAKLDPAHFCPPRDLILSAICKCQDNGVPISALTVGDQMKMTGDLDRIGGQVTLSDLVTNEKTRLELDGADHCLNCIRDRAAERMMRTTLAEIPDGLSTEAMLNQVRKIASKIEELSSGPRLHLPEIEDICDLLAEPADLPPDVIAGLLSKGGKMVVGGGSKSFKTWILTDCALSVATGADWLGCATRKGKVLYINLEIQRGYFRNRAESIGRAKAVSASAGMLEVWNLRGYAADLSTLIEEIKKRVGQRYDLIIVDPIYKVLGGRDENAAGDIAGLLNELERLAVESGAAVAFGAHFSKGNQAGKESIDRIGGSGVFARDPDSILVLTRHEEEDAFTLEATLRNHAPLDPFVVRWNFPLMVRDGSLDPAKLKQTGGRQKLHDSEELLGVLGDKELTHGQWLEAAKDHAGMSKGTFTTLRKELLRNDRVFQSPITLKYEQVKKVKKAN